MKDASAILGQALARWRRDPVAFVREALVNPETQRPFQLYPAQVAFLRAGLTPAPDGSLPFPELVFSCPKKSGKSTFAGIILLYVIIVLGGQHAEGYCLANDEEQAQGRVFEAARRIIEASPLLRASVKVAGSKLTFIATGATITAIASDYASAAGASPSISVFDELWAYTSERARRLFDEMMPVPTRRPSIRLTVTYAGFSGESELLESLYQRAVAGQQIAPDLYRTTDGLLAYWTHECRAPWQTQEWIDASRAQLRPNQFARMIENRWTNAEDVFIPLTEWDAITDDNALPIFSSPSLDVYVAVDASTKHDSTAIAATAWVNDHLQLVNLRTFQPSPDAPLDFESTVEATLLEWRQRYRLREVRIDPWQMASVAQRLRKAGLNVVEYAQSLPNLSAMASNLYELVRSRTLTAYPDANLRRAVAQAIAVEGARGWKIDKAKQAHKIDPLIALAMAALAAVERKGVAGPLRVAHFGGSPAEAFAELFGGPRHVADLPSFDLGFTDIHGRPIREGVIK